MFSFYVAASASLCLAVYALRRTRVANVALLLCTISVCVTLIEGYYRFVWAESDGFALLSANFARRYYHLDHYGLRASNLPLSRTTPNLIVVGDSHVFGAGLKSPKERFSERLAAHYPQLHVVNLGWLGADTRYELEQLRRYRDDPNAPVPLVVLTYFFNDIEDEVTPDDWERLGLARPAAQVGRIDRTMQWLSRYSRVLQLFYYRLGYARLVRTRTDEIKTLYRDPAILERHLDTLQRLRSLAEGHSSTRLLLLLLPFLHTDELLNDRAFYTRFEEALAARQFQFIDMQPAFAAIGAKKLRVSHFDPHPNAFANQLIANALAKYLDQHRELIRPPAPAP